MIHSTELAKKINYGVDKPLRLRAIIQYLLMKGLVDVRQYVGPECHVRLAAKGYTALEQYALDDSVAMSNAYMLLYKLENHLRRFIESKLITKYGDNWWNQGISEGHRKKVDEMYAEEKATGWQIAKTDSKTEYLMFKHIEGIIAKNWTEVFQPIFTDLPKIQHRLQELESIRNAIGHCRTLSDDAYSRLQKYSQDIYNLTTNS